MTHDHIRKYFVAGHLVPRRLFTRITCSCGNYWFPHRWRSGHCTFVPRCITCDSVCKLTYTGDHLYSSCCNQRVPELSIRDNTVNDVLEEPKS